MATLLPPNMESSHASIKKPLERLMRNRYIASPSKSAKKARLDSPSTPSAMTEDDEEASPNRFSDVKEEEDDDNCYGLPGGGPMLSSTSELVRISVNGAAAVHLDVVEGEGLDGVPSVAGGLGDDLDFDMDEEAARLAEQKMITADGVDVSVLYKQMIAGLDENSDAVKWGDTGDVTDVSSFTSEQTLALIDCVRSLPILWEAIPGASQKAKRDGWNACAELMRDRGYDVDSRLCNAKFRILRDSYMRIVRKTSQRGERMPEKRGWQFFEPLRFLGDCVPAAGKASSTEGRGDEEGACGSGVDGSRASSNAPEEVEEEGEVSRSYNDILLSSTSTALMETIQAINCVHNMAAAEETAVSLNDVLKVKPKASGGGSKKSKRKKRQQVEMEDDLTSAEGLTASSSASVSSKNTPRRGASSECMEVNVMGAAAAVAAEANDGSRVAEPLDEDTWERYGSHVSDVLREMRKLDEDAAWDARLAIDALLLEKNRLLRTQRRATRKDN